MIEVGDYDIKKVEIELLQIAYSSGECVSPIENNYIEYDIDILSSIWSVNEHQECDILSYMKEKNEKAICIPREHPEGWICSCGRLNKSNMNSCVSCGYSKVKNFNEFKEDIILTEIEKRTIEKKQAEEREKEARRIEEQKAEKQQKIVSLSVAGAILLVIAIIIGSVVINNIKYGLSDEEKVQYDIAQKNYDKIDYFVMGLGNDYYDISNEYFDDDYSYNHNRENCLSKAEKDADYLYSRGMYLASSLLFPMIENQYPKKYRETYNQLVHLKAGDVYNDYLITETMYVKNVNASNMIDRREGIDTAIDIMEEYMDKEVLNPTKVELAKADMPTPNYSNVYGINLGILFYDDGNIKYIGEVKDGKANGYGEAWYSSEDGGGRCRDGQFTLGKFESGKPYGTDGNSVNVSDLTDMVFEGDFVMISGVSTSQSSEQIAQQNEKNEKQDREKAAKALEMYLNDLAKKQSSIKNITWFSYPKEVSGDYYYFSCTVEYSGLERDGIVTVKKNSDGTFKATGLEFDD